jgi:hypothetical protein
MSSTPHQQEVAAIATIDKLDIKRKLMNEIETDVELSAQIAKWRAFHSEVAKIRHGVAR